MGLSKFIIIFVAICLMGVQSFAPAMKSRVASNTELNALFSLKKKEKSPTVTIEKPGKKGAAVAEKEVVKKEKKNPFARFAKPAAEEKEVAVVAKKEVVKKAAPVKKIAPKKPVAKKVVAVKKAVAVKKPVAKKKKIVKQTTATFKTSTTKGGKEKKKLVIYDRQCHIN